MNKKLYQRFFIGLVVLLALVALTTYSAKYYDNTTLKWEKFAADVGCTQVGTTRTYDCGKYGLLEKSQSVK